MPNEVFIELLENITQKELDCMQLNACVTNFLQSVLCEDIQEAIFEMKEIHHDAHLIWATLKCKYGGAKFLDMKPGSSGSEREAERHRPNDESSSVSSAHSHYDHHQCFVAMSEDQSDPDSDSDDDEEFMLELGKMNKKSRETIIEMMKQLMKQDQDIEIQRKLLSDKDKEIKSLALIEKKDQALAAQVDELTIKHMDLQALHMDLKGSNEKLLESYAMLEVANENKVLKQEVERLSKELTKMKGKSIIQPSQDNHETMVKKLEKGSTVQTSCNQVHKSNKRKPQAKKKNLDHIKCFKCSNMRHYASISLDKRRCFGCCKKGHKIATCPSKSNVLSGTTGSFGFAKPKVPNLAVQHHYKLNKGFKRVQAQYLERKDVRNKENKPASNLKYKVCYTCRGKGHLGKDCPNGNTSKSNLVNNLHVQLRRSNDGVCAGRMIKSSTFRPKAIWVSKSLLTNLCGPNTTWVPKCA
ncbi:hypothetical protein GQ55_6G138700 [Panicum hallii var. hallii]|uniref:CCHC-type domain-containing protein n=1 Tax=Panicum hallii var. hallii TaxID=1504633 RepID=A0A2T7D647_9POAL|nr:hypothetical protein GQ55_6G138700 [Panicum hallii var. hallii]